MKMEVDEIVYVKDEGTEQFIIEPGKLYKFVRSEGVLPGTFQITGRSLVGSVKPGHIILGAIPHELERFVACVNLDGGELTKFKNTGKGDFDCFVTVEEDTEGSEILHTGSDKVILPKLFRVWWQSYQRGDTKDVTVEILPLPYENALLIQYVSD